MKRLTEEDLILLRDTFPNSEGDVISDEIDDQTVFPIAAGPWPSEFANATQTPISANHSSISCNQGLDV
ncbi:MAG TPA: hypothetical protein VK638_11160, partial [Edaphobacter sp.]|nr:hypothetical protein [Edaphobacter sp.]